jgi:iron complex transport system substrate-binding protein
MRRALPFLLYWPRLGWVAGLALLCAQAAASTLQITDDRGVTLRFDAAPRRIVSLLPSLTETVCALGQCQRLVGVDRFSNWPASVRSLPQLGGLEDAPIEAIVALKPDVVLLAASARVTARLESLGIKVLALEPKNFADVQRVLHQLGVLLDVSDADRVWRGIDAAMLAAVASVPTRSRGAKVYFEVSREPYAAGASSFIGEMLTRLGLGNIVPAALGPFPQLNPEFVVRADPDLIVIGDGSAQGLEQRPGWASMRALRERHICAFKPEQADMLVRPGPRMAQAAQLIAQCARDKTP